MYDKIRDYIEDNRKHWFKDSYTTDEIAKALYDAVDITIDYVDSYVIGEVRYLFDYQTGNVDENVIYNILRYTHSVKRRENKEYLLEDICCTEYEPGRNSLGCYESWYNSYYCIQQTFSREQLKEMTLSEIHHLIDLADNITEALY